MTTRVEDIDPTIWAKATGEWSLQEPLVPLPGYFDDDGSAWLNRHVGYCERAQRGNVRVLFIGDSITEGWSAPEQKPVWDEFFAPLDAANFGIGGDRTQQILWRIEDGTLEGIEPEVVVLLIGVNNLWAMQHTADEVAAGIEAVVALLQAKLPRAKVLLQGILPTGEEADNPLRAIIKDINRRISRLDDGNRVRFYDFGNLFLEPDGRIGAEKMPDFCHLSPTGYRMWAEALSEPVKAMLGPA
jgi:lysophospholipase L1-like esterase